MANYIDNTNRFGTIVNNGRIYDFLPCKETMVPDNFLFVTDAGDVPLLEKGNLILTGCGRNNDCQPLSIPYQSITTAAWVKSCTTPVAQVVSFDCFQNDCGDNIRLTMKVVRDISYCSQMPKEWLFTNSYDCGNDTEATCNQKLTKFAAILNTQYEDAPFTASVTDDTITLTAKVAGEGFSVVGLEGLTNATVVTANVPESFYGKDFTEWDASCVPGLCEADKCYTVVMFKYLDLTPFDGGSLGGSSWARASNKQQIYVEKQMAIVIDETINAGYVEALHDIMDGTATVADYFNKWDGPTVFA